MRRKSQLFPQKKRWMVSKYEDRAIKRMTIDVSTTALFNADLPGTSNSAKSIVWLRQIESIHLGTTPGTTVLSDDDKSKSFSVSRKLDRNGYASRSSYSHHFRCNSAMARQQIVLKLLHYLNEMGRIPQMGLTQCQDEVIAMTSQRHKSDAMDIHLEGKDSPPKKRKRRQSSLTTQYNNIKRMWGLLEGDDSVSNSEQKDSDSSSSESNSSESFDSEAPLIFSGEMNEDVDESQTPQTPLMELIDELQKSDKGVQVSISGIVEKLKREKHRDQQELLKLRGEIYKVTKNSKTRESNDAAALLQLQLEKEEAKLENETLRKKIVESEEQMEDLRKQVDTLSQQMNLEKMNGGTRRLTDAAAIVKLETENEDMKSRNEMLQNKMVESERLVNDLRKQVDALSQQMNLEKMNSGTRRLSDAAAIAKLEMENEETESGIEMLQQNIVESGQLIRDLREQTNTLSQQMNLERANSKAKQLSDELALEKANSEIQRLQTKLGEYECLMEDLRTHFILHKKMEEATLNDLKGVGTVAQHDDVVQMLPGLESQSKEALVVDVHMETLRGKLEKKDSVIEELTSRIERVLEKVVQLENSHQSVKEIPKKVYDPQLDTNMFNWPKLSTINGYEEMSHGVGMMTGILMVFVVTAIGYATMSNLSGAEVLDSSHKNGLLGRTENFFYNVFLGLSGYGYLSYQLCAFIFP